MGLFDDAINAFSGGGDSSIVSAFDDVLGGSGSVGSPVASTISFPTYSYPATPQVSNPFAMQTAAAMPLAARAVAAGLPAWSARFPSLWQALQRLRASGSRANIAQLMNMMRKWGPTAMAGVIGAQAVSDLFAYKMTHKTRRMNPANTRALRRSLRRLKSFDRLSHRVSMQLSHSCHRRGRKKAA